MKKLITIGLILVALLLLPLLVGIYLRIRAGGDDPAAYSGTTQAMLSGTTGAVVTGYFVRDGQRTAVSNALPFRIELERLSRLELRKLNPADTLIAEMRYEGNGARASMKTSVGAGSPGIRVRVRNGLISETMGRAE